MNQFVGADFEGTPINQLIGNNNNNFSNMNNGFGNMNNSFGNMNGGYAEPPATTLFQQPSRDIRNLVSNINNQLDNVSFNASNYSQESKKSNKYQENTTSEEEEVKRKLKKKLKKRKEKKRKIEEELEDLDEEEQHTSFLEWAKYLSNDTKELLLIITIYFILSLGFVKKTVGEYISVINPNESGKYPFIGVLIYGFLLAVLFIAFKKVLIN
jgi:hypothetical protein